MTPPPTGRATADQRRGNGFTLAPERRNGHRFPAGAGYNKINKFQQLLERVFCLGIQTKLLPAIDTWHAYVLAHEAGRKRGVQGCEDGSRLNTWGNSEARLIEYFSVLIGTTLPAPNPWHSMPKLNLA